MKLLFDENLSPRLPQLLASEYPGSVHVEDVGLRGSSDGEIRDYCRLHGLAITSKDSDFQERSFIEGSPPKVLMLQVGNAGTTEIAGLLKRVRAEVEAFDRQQESSCLILALGPKELGARTPN